MRAEAEVASSAPRLRSVRPVILVGLATAFSLLGDQTLYVVLPTNFMALGLLPFHVGLILSVNRWIRLLTNQLAEWLNRRYSPTLLLALALGLGASTTFAYGLVASFPVFLMSRVLWGLSWSFIRQVGLMTVVETVPSRHLGRMMGYHTGISRTGGVAGNVGGALGHDLIGFTATMVIFGALSLIGVPLGILARRGLKRPDRLPSRPSSVNRWWDPSLLGCGWAVGCVGTGLVMSTLGFVLHESVGGSVTVAGIPVGVASLTGLLLGARWVVDLTVTPLLGTLSDRMGRRSSALLFLTVGAVILAGMAATANPLVLVLLVLAFFMCGAGASVVLVAESGTRGARAVAGYVTAADVGSASGPLLGWLVVQLHWDSGWIYGIGHVLYLVAAVAAWTAFGRRGAETEPVR